ncbi:RIP metalloprotease RseP [Mailhella massiliensis]|uniref:Zinc metalloprotease n=1 Tax=Mailhella massiliensis TaxID=1903261 RepID=A0A921AYF7_9BACT|nr:RIP metalloprotease RseP [Mailhella massiliensis]HJD98189.1 RIP metalloprotease RseP [Mailhella massiliensis]
MQSLLHYLSYWDSALAVVLVFGGLIFFHELGHFLAFRAFKVGVITFSIGMGPKMCSFRRGKTEYRLSWLPFGGYVSGVGEYSDEVESLGFTQEEAVTSKPAWQRLIIAFAGPFMNLIIAWLIYWGLTMSMGLAVTLPQVGGIVQGSAAMEAGILPGDMITAIDDAPVDRWEQVPDTVGESGGRTLEVEVEREGKTLHFSLMPTRSERTNIFGETETAWLIGVQASGAVRYEEKGFLESAVLGLRQTWGMIDLTLTSVKKLVTGSVAADAVGGPILIAQMLGRQAEAGLAPLLMLTALISVNLGLLNLFPIPVLDGGSILFCIVEIIVRRPVPEKVQDWSMRVGASLLIALMVFATFNDVMRWFR